MSFFFPYFKIFISKILILSCFDQFIWKSWYSQPDTGQYIYSKFQSNSKNVHWVNRKLQTLFWYEKQKFVEWVNKIKLTRVYCHHSFSIIDISSFKILNLVSWFSFAIKKRIWKYLYSSPRQDLIVIILDSWAIMGIQK